MHSMLSFDKFNTQNYTGPKASKVPVATKISTGTSILALPYNEGYLLISDTRATNTSTYEYYTTDKLTPYGTNFALGGAGAACGTVAVLTPFLDYFTQYLKYYNYDLEQIPEPYAFLTLWNTACLKYLQEQASPIYLQLLSQCIFLVVFRNKHFNFTLKASLTSDDLLENYNSYSYNCELAKTKKFSGDILAIGSGARYLVGGAMSENDKKIMKERSKDEILELLPTLFKNTTTRDLASSVEAYLEVVTVPNDLTQPVLKKRHILP